MADKPPERRVSSEELRRTFNDGGLWEAAQAGDFVIHVRRSGPAPAKAGQPAGTLTQMVEYFAVDGRMMALVHQYLRPDGTIGGSGRAGPQAATCGR